MNEDPVPVPPDLPGIRGIHHIKLPVSDLERTAAWYIDILGARRRGELDHRRPDGTLYSVILDVPGLPTLIELRLDPPMAGALRGYDLITLTVPDRAALDQCIDRLDALGVEHSPPIVAKFGWLLVLVDPDGQWLRLYTAEPHGLDPSRVEHDSPWLTAGPAEPAS